MSSVISHSRSLKNQRFTPSGCRALGIRTFKFVAKTQLLILNMFINKVI